MLKRPLNDINNKCHWHFYGLTKQNCGLDAGASEQTEQKNWLICRFVMLSMCFLSTEWADLKFRKTSKIKRGVFFSRICVRYGIWGQVGGTHSLEVQTTGSIVIQGLTIRHNVLSNRSVRIKPNTFDSTCFAHCQEFRGVFFPPFPSPVCFIPTHNVYKAIFVQSPKDCYICAHHVAPKCALLFDFFFFFLCSYIY